MKTRNIIVLFCCVLAGLFSRLNAQCNADFLYSSKACQNSTLSFTAKDTHSATQFAWNFDDPFSGTANIDSSKSPNHEFVTPGKYQVQLIAYDTNCRDTQTYQIEIYKLPDANFTVENGCTNLLTQFKNTTTSDTADPIGQWKWLFNTDTSTQKSPQKTFNSIGNSTVKLIAISNTGCTDTVVKTISIYKKPTASTDLTEICQNGQVDFTADTIYNANSYRWNFGDSTFFTQRQVTHVYKTFGAITPKLTVDFGSTTCTIDLNNIKINKAPDARFYLPTDTFCFKNNNVCVVLKNIHQKIKSRSVLFDDGFLDDSSPLTDSIICHKYSDTSGGLYSITVELIDSTNCFARFTQKDAILIHPILIPDFTFNNGLGCFKTSVNIDNISNRTPPYISKYLWDFGDGNLDSIHWDNLKHDYTSDGLFNINLKITDKFGCSENKTSSKAVQNTNFVVDARIDSMKGICRNNNLIYFKQSTVTGATIRWNIPSGLMSTAFQFVYRFPLPGIYKPFVTVSKNGCDSTISLDSVTIHGPVANIGGITNRYQCQIKDTVYFSNASSTFLNNNISVFWDAGDYNASSCTTNIQNGINVGQNCRYSTDSAAFKHFYSPGSEGCYYVKLLVYDTSIGCRDSTYAPLPLRAPEAKGKFVASDTSACPGPETWKALTFNINLPEPTCLKYSWYVMWDSLAAIRSGNFDSLWVPNSVAHNYSYNDYAGDSSGYVSVGLIVENGTDTNGNICRDTGWFHKIVKVYHTNPNFTSSYNPAVYNCPNTTHYFFLKDSQQTAGTNFYWDFGDGSSLSTQSQNFVSHTFKKSGTYHVKLSVMADNRCTVDSSILINIGFQSNFSLSSAAKCVGDSFQISENNLYHNTGYSPAGLWRNPTRTAAGKEKIWYDLDDGNGFVDMGPNPLVKPKTPGNFSISMLSRDSVGCFDTLLNFASIKVSGMYAGFTTLYDTFLCAQTIQINNAATVVDSISNKSLNGDVITKWEYNFGNNYPQSFVPNPRRYFVTGNYQIRQIVVNSSGCIDTFIKNISVIGPKSKFSIISDTIGCAPLKITFQNNSQNASSYIWQFNDINNSSFSTKQDTNVAFKFLGYGNYYPRLVARGSFTINGTTQVCDDIYPDTSMALKKTVSVWELPKPNFTYSTNCATGTTAFKNTSAVATSSLVYEKWFFGDGDSSLGPNPVHVYADTGTYKIVLKVRSAQGCEDSVVRNIVVSPSPIPYFGYNYNCHGTPTLFKDSSFAYNDRVYLWNWNFGDGTTSNQKNPQKTFAKDTTYQVKLTITNIAGCTENITRPILIYSKPVVKFNNNNTCDKQKVFALNNTTCKQPIQSWKWSFGDGYTSTKWNDTHVYAGYGNYSIKLSVKSVNGCSDSITKITVISPNPSARIYLDTPNMCWKYHSFVFTDSSKIPLGTTTAAWNLGDLMTNNSKKFNYKYNQFGTYTIQLISKSDKGCNDTAWHNLTVHPMPEPAFTLNDSAQCSKYNSILFNDAGNIALGTYSIRWEFGDGTQSNNNPAVHHYNDTGAFNSKQILKSNKNCIDTATKKIRIWEMPKPGIAANDSGQCLLGNQFKFFNLSTYSKNNLSWNWNYGNGQKDTSKNPVFSYNKDSIYTVQLTAISTNNCKDTAALKVEVFPMPIADFLVNDSAQCLTNNQFNFTNLSTVKKGVLGYRWKFGDGDSSTALSPGHTFKKEGTYSINLIAKSSFGCSDTTSKNTTVHPMPLLNWAVNQPNFCILNQAFVFSDSSKIAYGTTTGKWDFGDSTFSSLKKANKTFNYPGTKSVKLIHTSDKGCKDSLSKTVEVYPKPYAAFSVNDSLQCFNYNQFNFNNLTKISAGSYNSQWQFGDSTQQNAQNASHKYKRFGPYFVKLITSSNNSCKDSTTVMVEVLPMPGIGFITNKDSQCFRGNNYIFTPGDTGGAGTLTYLWNFGDSVNSTAKNPSHQYSFDGKKQVLVRATTAKHCSDSALKILVLHPMPKAKFSINDTAQCGNTQQFIFTDNSTISSGSILRKWIFNDSNSIYNPIQRTFLQDTFHSIILTQTSEYGCADSISRKILVHSVPKVLFSTNDSEQCLRQNQFYFVNKTKIKNGAFLNNWNLGDLNTSTDFEPIHKYNQYGNYFPVLKATSDKGCIDSMIGFVKVNPMPQVGFTVNDTGQCINNQLFVFDNLSTIDSGSITSFWKFGNGDTSALFEPIKTYTKDTNFTVWLTETSNKNCIDSAKMVVDVYPKPILNFTLNDSIQCLRQNNYIFKNNSQIKYGSIQYLWSFGDANTSALSEPVHQYASFGNFKVQLHGTSNLGCIDSIRTAVEVGAMPVVNYSVNDDGQCLKTQQFDFTNASVIGSGSMKSYWYFGDSDTSQMWNAQHFYLNKGNYTSKLVMVSNYNCMDSSTLPVRVFPNSNAYFTTNDSDQCQNQQNYVFTNASTVSPGNIRFINWDLGNGQSSTNNVVKAYYNISGFYTVKLTTTTDSGCIDSYSNIVRVYPKPAAWFNVNDSAQCLFQNNYIFDDVSYDSVGVNLYKWNINNEVLQTTKQAQYKFLTPGFKNINLISTSLRGCSDTIDRIVYVKPMPDPGFEKLKDFYCELTGPINFSTTTPGGTFTGKNIISNVYFPIKLWTDTITYEITVNGCTDSSKQKTEVYPGPKVDLGADTTMCKYEILELTINSWQSQYVWDNGSNNVTRKITKPGIYAVTVTNICGVKSDTIEVKYRDINCRFFLPLAFTPNGDGMNDRYTPLAYNLEEMDYSIYNRWGAEIYRGKLGDNGWDGNYMEAFAPSGTYIISVRYMYDLGYRQVRETASASFELLR